MPPQTRSANKQNEAAKEIGRILIEVRYRCEKTCAICRTDMYGSKVFHLPCGHTFHVNCFKQQLQYMQNNNSNCACCRYDLTSALNQNTELKSLIPDNLQAQNDLREAFDILLVYRFISNVEELNNMIVSYQPMNTTLHEHIENNASENDNSSNDSRDSEDIWFANSRLHHRNIEHNSTNLDVSANVDVSGNADASGTQDISNNTVFDNTTNVDIHQQTIDDYNAYFPYDQIEFQQDIQEDSDYEDLPQNIPNQDLGAEPYEYDFDFYMSDDINYGTTPEQSDSSTDSDEESMSVHV